MLTGVLFFVIYLVYITRGCNSKDFSEVSDMPDYEVRVYVPERRLTIILFTFLAIAFLWIGITLTLNLRTHHTQFYNEHKCLLWLMTFSLSAPLLFRSVFDLFTKLDEHFVNQNNSALFYALYNAAFFLVTDLVPIFG